MKDSAPSGRDVDRIRETLANAAPPDEGSASRADAVMRRARRARSRNGLVGAVAVGVAAAAVIIGPQFIDSSPVTNPATDTAGTTAAPSNPSPTNTGPTNEATNEPANSYPDPYLDHRCPAEPIEASPSAVQVPPFGSSVLELQPTDVMVRLCRASGAGIVSPWEPPRDGLVYDLDAFADRIAELPVVEPDLCPAARPVPQPFAMQVTDSAGETETMVSLLTTCGTVKVNSQRVSAEALLRVFAESLAEQRAAGGFEPDPADLSQLECHGINPAVPTSWMSELTPQTRFVAAATCRSSTDRGIYFRPEQASMVTVELLNREWAASAVDVRTPEEPVYGCPALPLDPGSTFAMTTWGDVVHLRMLNICGVARVGPFELGLSKRLLDRLSLPYKAGELASQDN